MLDRSGRHIQWAEDYVDYRRIEEPEPIKLPEERKSLEIGIAGLVLLTTIGANHGI